MIRILIVDDEHTIRRGLELSIPWKEHGFTVIGTAKNGIDALDFFQNNYADIVISDIKMPRMDGLELQRQLHERYPELPFLFISGYEDFDYARQALRAGAFSYLLKPLDPDDLLKELKRACQHYQLSSENIPLKQIIERNFYGLEKRWDFTNFEYLQNDCESHYFCVINIRCRMDDMRSQLFMMSFQNKLQEIVLENFSQQNSALIEASSHGVIFCVTNSSEDILKYTINKFVNAISTKLADYSTTPVGIWTGGVYQGITHLIDSYVESFENDSFKYFNQAKEEQDNPLSFDIFSQLFEDEDIIISNLYRGELEQAIALLEKQKETLISNKLNADDARLYLRHLLHKHLRAQKKENPSVIFPEAIHSYGIFALMTIPEMFDTLYDALKQIAHLTKPLPTSHGTQTIDKVKTFIFEHYFDPYLSLSSIADYVGLNPSYLSTEFTKREKMGLSNYITEVRMEHAKKLLARSDMNVSDISAATGYLNPTYFSTNFKRAVGVTPSQYRKSLIP
ncbi:MAG: response regulator [Eubacteriales bacterium]